MVFIVILTDKTIGAGKAAPALDKSISLLLDAKKLAATRPNCLISLR